MPRISRAAAGGYCYHLMNRGNAGARVFHNDADYETFLQVLQESLAHVPIRVLGWCLLPDAFHLVVWPKHDGDLSRWMNRIMTGHVRRYHVQHDSVGQGHIWQGRYRSFPVQPDEHLLAVLRHVERAPLREKVVRGKGAQAWRWSSRGPRTTKGGEDNTARTLLHESPVALPRNWATWVNQIPNDAEVVAIQRSIQRGAPYGDEKWIQRTVARLGLESTLRPRGRPRKYPVTASGTKAPASRKGKAK